jgi:hypothetical protein
MQRSAASYAYASSSSFSLSNAPYPLCETGHLMAVDLELGNRLTCYGNFEMLSIENLPGPASVMKGPIKN